ncbi:MAG: DUF3426 domain-containing protein [Desulfobacteraceae bacterium]|nr:MAG: DUF3426 domain-containing protein [Desulfobacteraceae bacterium]
MFITCRECNTTFRLDERLLKPTGSKVRCSQCLNTFVAVPVVRPLHFEQKSPVPAGSSASQSRLSPRAVVSEQELEGIDLAELDAILEGDPASEMAVPAEEISDEALEVDSAEELSELDELDLDFDFDAALEPGDENRSAAPATQDPKNEIDLEIDFDIADNPAEPQEELPADLDLDALSLDEAPGPEAKAEGRKKPENASLEGDLDMILDDLDLESVKKPDTSAGAPAARSNDDLDLADLDLELGDGVRDERTGVEEQELSLADDEPDLDAQDSAGAEPRNEGAGNDLDGLELEMDDSTDDAAEAPDRPELELTLDSSSPDAGEDLDLSGLDAILEADGKTDKKPLDEADLNLGDDPELELEIDDHSASQAESEKSSENEPEDLEFELDREFEDKGTAEKPHAEDATDVLPEDDEIDLSDIEEMLGREAASATPPKADSAEEKLGLADDSGEIDLSEIESAIDEAEKADTGAGSEESELELDLDLDAGKPSHDRASPDELQLDLSPPKGEPDAEELDLELELELENEPQVKRMAGGTAGDELDLSDLADLVDDDRGSKPVLSDTGDQDLRFRIEDEDLSVTAGVSAKTGSRIPASPFDDTMETMLEDKSASKSKHIKPKQKRGSKSLVVLLILLLLAGAAYGLYYGVTQMGIEIPYVSDYLRPKAADPGGTVNLSTLDINSKFIENSQSGRLFVITGKVRNGYNVPRSTIRLQGKLFTKGKVLVKTEYSYAGTVIDDQDLAALSIAEIKQRLNQDVPRSVRPGQNMPFMLVFSDLPPAEQLDEFAVEMIGSTPGA